MRAVNTQLRPARQRGLSLAELLISVGLLGMIAAVAIPAVTREHSETTNSAAHAVAGALRFARDQAALSGEIHGVEIDARANQLRVFRLESTARPIYTVRHPLTRQLYTLNFGVGIYRSVQLEELIMASDEVCNDADLLGFNANGVSLCTNPTTVPVSAVISVSVNGNAKAIKIDPTVGLIVAE